jgi:hypothetical protein
MINYGIKMKYILKNFFTYGVAIDVLNEENYVSKTLKECMHKNNWPKWKDVLKPELDSLEK